MSFRSGIDTQFGCVAETTWGTYAVPTRFLDYVSETLKYSITPVIAQGLRKGKRVERTDQWSQGKKSVAGDVMFEIANKGYGLLLKHMLGSSTKTTPGTLCNKYQNVLADTYGLGLTVQIGRPDTGGTVNAMSYLGCKVAAWEISCAVDGVAGLKLSLDGAAEDSSQGLAAASAPTASEWLYWHEGSLTIAGGASLPLSSVSFTGNNGLKTDRHFILSGGTTKKEQLAAAMVPLGGTMTVEFDGMTNYNRFVNGTVATVVFTLLGSQIEAGQNYKLVVTCQNVRFDGDTPNVSGPGVLDLTLPFTVLDDGTNPPIDISYFTTDAAA